MFQTRSEYNGIKEYPTFKEALDAAKADESIWKISFGLPTGERVRLVSRHGTNGMFAVEQIEDAIATELIETATPNKDPQGD